MSSIGTGYDLSASQFSPDGRVFQVEYASKAVEKSGSIIGLRGKDVVVLAVEKFIISPLYEDDANARIFTIDKNIGLGIAGVLADGRFLVDIAQQEAFNYKHQYQRTIPLQDLCDRLSHYVHSHTLYSAVRPFGVTILLTAWDEDQGPQLFKIEPSGLSFGYFACASGKAKQMAKTEIEKIEFQNMEVEELVQSAGKIIYYINDELKDKNFHFEMSVVGKTTNGLHQINPEPWYSIARRTGEAYKDEDDSDNEI